ncbi:hypothetical protein Avbf_07878 [Armadillidium vulgare]|nr:hypothetical protein Avbf_07878 [Armadillidium vulgare]
MIRLQLNINIAWEIGLVNKHIPQKYGGLGMNNLEGGLVTEEFAYGCSAYRDMLENYVELFCLIYIQNISQLAKHDATLFSNPSRTVLICSINNSPLKATNRHDMYFS